MPTRTLYKWNEHWGNTFHCLPADVQKHFNMHLAINIKRCYRGNQIDAKSGCWSGFMGKKSHREKYGACLIRDKQPWAYVSRPPCMPPTHPPAVSYLCQGIHFMQSKNLPRKARWPPLPNLCQGLSQHFKSVSYHISRTNVWPQPVLIASALRLALPDLTLECVNWGFSLKFQVFLWSLRIEVFL